MPILNIDGDRLHYADSAEGGDGVPVVFVHGSCGGGGQWKSLAGALSEDYRTICIDLFGSGRSEPWPIERHWTTRDDERAIDAVLDLLAEPVHFVVHSGGGCFSYPSIKSHRAQIKSLTLFEPVYFHLLHQSNDPLFAEPEDMANRYRAALDDGDTERAMASFVDAWARQDGAWNKLPEPVKAFMRLGSNRLYHEWRTPWFEEPSRDDLTALGLPALLFKGRDTIASMHRVCEIAEQAIPGCRTIEIEGAGHMSPFTHATTALPHLREHLAKNEGAV